MLQILADAKILCTFQMTTVSNRFLSEVDCLTFLYMVWQWAMVSNLWEVMETATILTSFPKSLHNMCPIYHSCSEISQILSPFCILDTISTVLFLPGLYCYSQDSVACPRTCLCSLMLIWWHIHLLSVCYYMQRKTSCLTGLLHSKIASLPRQMDFSCLSKIDYGQ